MCRPPGGAMREYVSPPSDRYIAALVLPGSDAYSQVKYSRAHTHIVRLDLGSHKQAHWGDVGIAGLHSRLV